MSSILVGMIRQVAKQFFNQSLTIKALTIQDQNVEYSSWIVIPTYNKEKQIEEKVNIEEMKLVDVIKSSTREDLASSLGCHDDKKPSQSLMSTTCNQEYGFGLSLSGNQLNTLYPFHIVFSKNMKILQFGSVLSNHVNITENDNLDELFTVISNPYSLDWEALVSMEHGVELVLLCKTSSSHTPHDKMDSSNFSLSGSIIFSSDKSICYYLASRNVRPLNDIVDLGLSMSDWCAQPSKLELLLKNENLIRETKETMRLQATLKELEEEKDRTMNLMREVNQATAEALSVKKCFVRYVSHEIRTPLTVASLGLMLLRDDISKSGANTAELDSSIEQCEENINIAVSILNDLLSYEKLESGILELHKKVVKAKDCIPGVVDLFKLQVLVL